MTNRGFLRRDFLGTPNLKARPKCGEVFRPINVYFNVVYLTALTFGSYRSPDMSAQVDRRHFLRSSLAAASRPLLGRIALGTSSAGHDPDIDASSRTAWFRAAKFGMFIHWGPYSAGQRRGLLADHAPDTGGITEAEYRALPARFNPSPFDPDALDRLGAYGGPTLHGVHHQAP